MKDVRVSLPTPIGRRQFLGTVGAAATTALVAPAAAVAATRAGTEPAWKMLLATSSIHYLHLPVEKSLERIGKLGFEGVDIWSAHAGCPHLDDILARLGPDGLKAALKKTGLKLFAFSVYRGGYEKYAKLLGESGGGVAVQGSAGPVKPGELTARMRTFIEKLRPATELAEKHDSYLAIENHGNALLDSVDSMKAFVDLNRSPRLGIALAPYHVQALGESVPEAISVCGRQLLFFYAWQKAKGVAQLPGHGPTDFKPWLSALAKVRYRGYVNPFMHGDLEPDEMSRALAKSRDYLTKCYAETVKK